MCGIAAIFSYGEAPQVSADELMAIRDAMTARGPDGCGLWISDDRRLALAHRRLAIIDLSEAGAQPMTTPDGRLSVVFNGEIYNYKELRASLEQKGNLFHSHSDTEVLLHLYADLGPEMVHRLRGMFAFVIWDSQKQGIFLARDPFGIKPVYYADDGSTIRIASQVKALLAGKSIDTTPDPAGHVGFFLWGSVPEPHTLYKNIRALPAGSTLWVDNTGKKALNNYCSISTELKNAVASDFELDGEATREYLGKILLDSVRHHFVADVPVGIFLSSGLDSVTLTALASEMETKDINTITLAFKEYRGTERDESISAESLAKYYGTKHQTCLISLKDFQDDLSHLLEVMDQPSINGVNCYFISKIAAQTGLKVAISGLGGDELFGGYPSFKKIPDLVKFLGPTRHVPFLGRSFRRLTQDIAGRFFSPKYAGLLEYGGSYGGAYLLLRCLFAPWELPAVLGEDLFQEGWRQLQPLLRLEETVEGIRPNNLKVSALEMSWYMRNQLLRDADWAGMAHSLEIRVPLIDVVLLRRLAPLLAANRPPAKKDMALAPSKAIPAEILHRKKTGFSIPVQEWLVQEKNGNQQKWSLRSWARTVYQAAFKI